LKHIINCTISQFWTYFISCYIFLHLLCTVRLIAFRLIHVFDAVFSPPCLHVLCQLFSVGFRGSMFNWLEIHFSFVAGWSFLPARASFCHWSVFGDSSVGHSIWRFGGLVSTSPSPYEFGCLHFQSLRSRASRVSPNKKLNFLNLFA